MWQWIARYGLGFAAVSLAGFWMFVFVYNVVICSLRIFWIKPFLKLANKATFLFLVPASLILWSYTPVVQEILTFRPRSAVAWVALLWTGAVWGFALSNQAAVSWRLWRKRRPHAAARWRTRLAPWLAEFEEWNVYDDPDYGRQPAEGTGDPPVPAYRRKVGRMRADRARSHLFQRPGMRWLNGAYRLRVHEIELALPHLPREFDGLRVLHLTDFHYSEVLSPRYFDHVIDEAAALKPDLIVLTGDFAGGNHLYRESIEIYRRLDAPMGKFAVRGNHDYSSEPEVLAYWMEREGIELLENRSKEWRRGDGTFRLAGTEYPYAAVEDWSALMGEADGAFRLVLSHIPDNAALLARSGADLILSGHTHGGQGRLPGVGPVFVPSRYGRRYYEGLYEVGEALLYVSAGVGLHTVPLRFRCRPEIALLKLCAI